MLQELTYHTEVLGIVGDILRVRARDVGFGDLAVVENWDREVFVRLTGLFKNLNYAQQDFSDYQELMKQIEELKVEA